MALRALKTFRVRELAALSNEAQRNVAAGYAPQLPNPFLPHKNLATGRWAPAKYSLRRQADLIKCAKSLNLLHLLPISPKYGLKERDLILKASNVEKVIESEWWQHKVDWQGKLKDEKDLVKDQGQNVIKKRVPSMTLKQMDGLGAIKLYAGRKRMFKGHKWERNKADRDKKTRMLMRDMKERITRYKEWYHRRRPNPLKPPRVAKAPKLPF